MVFLKVRSMMLVNELTFTDSAAEESFLELEELFCTFSPHSTLPSTHHQLTMSMFKNILENLSTELKELGLAIDPLICIYHYLLRKIWRPVSFECTEIRTSFFILVDLLFSCNGYRSSWEFLGYFIEYFGVEPELILEKLSISKLRFIFFGFLTKRFGAWTSSGKLRTAILNYACLYGYCDSYYGLVSLILLRQGIEVRGFILRPDIDITNRHNGNLRMQLALEILVALFNVDGDDDWEYLRTIWKSVPYPFLTQKEMFKLLEPFFHHLHSMAVCEEFAKRNTICPVPDATQPRSLKHLSRHTIRKRLHVDNRFGTEVIYALDTIPATLKGYLLLDSF